MAISINSQPNLIHSAGNDNWFAFNSNLYSFPDFKIIANVRDSSTLLNTLNLPTNPNYLSILNIKNIVNDWVSADFNPFITAATSSTAYRKYTIDIAETFSGLYVIGESVGGTIGTVSVVNNTTLTSISQYTPIESIKFLSGNISSPQLYVYDFATASNGYINQLTLSSTNTSLVAPTASIPSNTYGYVTLLGTTVYTTAGTSSTTQKLALKGNIDYLDYNSVDNYNGYVSGTQSDKFLTNAPKVVQIQPSEWATLTYINGTSSIATSVSIVDNLGGTYSISLSGLTASPVIDIPVGTSNVAINPNAKSYCVTLVKATSVPKYSTITWDIQDMPSGDWAIYNNQSIQITRLDGNVDTFLIYADAGEYGPEDLYTYVILDSYNQSINNGFRAKWNIQYVSLPGLSAFKITNKTTGTASNYVSHTVVSTVPVINYNSNTSGASVIVQLPASETRCYEISCLNTRWTPFRVAWLNSLGGIDYYTFKYISNSSKRITRDNFDRNLNYGYTNESRGITTYKLDNYDQYTVLSDLLDDDDSDWLSELVTSQEVFWLKGTEMIPITIISEQYDRSVGLENSQLEVTFRLSRTNRK
jgi:hypothetical protein